MGQLRGVAVLGALRRYRLLDKTRNSAPLEIPVHGHVRAVLGWVDVFNIAVLLQLKVAVLCADARPASF